MCWLVKILNPLRDFSTLFTRTCCRRGWREKQRDEKDERRTAEQVLLEQVMAFGFEKSVLMLPKWFLLSGVWSKTRT